ncbi:hypothetical protein GGR53DRAFT_510120 [Hypoxylon sp. FL1150]|nr:hypothetical protein GGR53DRAFT_510120 [Hypoxylon sp. FL1150]
MRTTNHNLIPPPRRLVRSSSVGVAMSNSPSGLSPIIKLPPKWLNTDFLSPSRTVGREKHAPSCLPAHPDHPQSNSPGIFPSSSLPPDSPSKTKDVTGLNLYTVILIARFHFRMRSKKRIASESQLRANVVLLNILHGFLCTRGGNAERGLANPDTPNIGNQIFLLLVLMYLLIRGGTLRHYENIAVAIGHDNFIDQKVTFSLFQVRLTGHARHTNRDRKFTGFSIPYLLKLHAVYYLEHATKSGSPVSDIKSKHRRRKLALRRRRSTKRAKIRWGRRRRV